MLRTSDIHLAEKRRTGKKRVFDSSSARSGTRSRSPWRAHLMRQQEAKPSLDPEMYTDFHCQGLTPNHLMARSILRTITGTVDNPVRDDI
jgi:hypothetical protein